MSDHATIGSRSIFPELQAKVYLAHSAIAPISAPVQQRMLQTISLYTRIGVQAVMPLLEERERLRKKLASLIHAHHEEIALTSNTSTGIIAIAQSLPWKQGDRIVLFEGEFPSNVTPWLQAAKEHLLPITMLSRPTEKERVLQEVEDTLKKGAKLLALSAVQFQSGFRMPLEEIGALCTHYGCLFFVDAIQACGAMPINVHTQKIDFLSSGGHKWLMGVEGTGFAFIKKEHIPSLKHNMMSWLSHQDGLGFLFEGSGLLRYDRPFKQDASMFEGGVTNAIGFAGLECSVDILLHLGIENIHHHILQYLEILEGDMQQMGFVALRKPHTHSNILSFQPPMKQPISAWVEAYAQKGIILSGPDGLLRIAPHWPNSKEEHSIFLEATQEIIQSFASR